MLFNSPKLQQAAGPIYLGPRFREVIQDGGRTFRNYAFAVGWMAHEMTHRWVAGLQWKESDPFGLLDTVQRYHWSPFLNVPAVAPVSPYYSDSPYAEESIMGGMVAVMSPNGGGHGEQAPWGAATGLSALDLYCMGLIGPEDVPETFYIAGAKMDASGAKGGEAMPVRIADIIAVNGPRTPPAKDAQRQFRFEIYLLHEDGRGPDPARVAQARGIEAAVSRYFDLATKGAMQVLIGR